jgi:hypothetical protein
MTVVVMPPRMSSSLKTHPAPAGRVGRPSGRISVPGLSASIPGRLSASPYGVVAVHCPSVEAGYVPSHAGQVSSWAISSQGPSAGHA